MTSIHSIGPVAGTHALPWSSDAQSLFRFVEDEVVRKGASPTCDLPDEDAFFSDGPFHAVAGLVDAISSGDPDPELDRAELRAAFAEAVSGRPDGLARLYPKILKSGAAAASTLLDALPAEAARMPNRIGDLGLLLLRGSPDREPVKFGMRILSVLPSARTQGSDARTALETIARHEEFTLHALDVVRGGGKPDERTVFAMARGTRGWGRVHLVGLLEGTDDPEIREWILLEGFRNEIMDEYLAYVAADTGGLLAALSRPDPNRELLDSAAEILVALCRGGPARGMTDWTDGAAAAKAFLARVAGRPPTFARMDACVELVRHVERMREEPAGPERWDPADEDVVEAAARAFLSTDGSVALVVRTIESGTKRGADARIDVAVDVAEVLRLDVWDALLRRQESFPEEQWIDRLAATRDPGRVARLATAAEAVRELDRVPEGGILGADRRGAMFHQSLELPRLLRALAGTPGTGRRIVSAGLRSPAPRSRLAAAATLRAWGPEAAGEDLVRLAFAAAPSESDVRVGEALSRFLGGGDPPR